MIGRPLFVYGTLRSDGAMAHLVPERRRGPARVRGRLFRMPAGYPALAADPRAGWVHGEWIDPVPEEVLDLLDVYEGVPEGLYQRVVLPVEGRRAGFDAWAWVMERPDRRGGVAIPEGRWRPPPRRAGRSGPAR